MGFHYLLQICSNVSRPRPSCSESYSNPLKQTLLLWIFFVTSILQNAKTHYKFKWFDWWKMKFLDLRNRKYESQKIRK